MAETEFAPETPRRSTFAGDPRQYWSLRRAVDALARAARAAGRPSFLWIAGLAFPSIGLGLALGVANAIFASELNGLDQGLAIDWMSSMLLNLSDDAAGLVLLSPFLFFIFRIQAGLARIAPPITWNHVARGTRSPRLRQAWRAGKGLTASAAGLFMMITLMIVGVLLLVVAPIGVFWDQFIQEAGEQAGLLVFVGVIVPCVVLMAIYGLTLSILHQLSLQSLACNRRGVSSALTHAWRLAKNDPWSTARTVAVGLMLDLALWVISILLVIPGGIFPLGQLAAGLLMTSLYGFAGVTRAGYWARAYHALGGLQTDEYRPYREASSADA